MGKVASRTTLTPEEQIKLDKLREQLSNLHGEARAKVFHAIRYLEKRIKILNHQKEYYSENREARLEYDKQYQDTHKEERAAYHHNHNTENVEVQSFQHVLYELEHKAERKAYHSKYYEENRADYLRRTHLRRARRMNAEGSFTGEEFVQLCVDQSNECTYCGCYCIVLVPDHMTPLCRGGSNLIENIAPACSTCNSSKGDKTYEEFVEWRRKFIAFLETHESRGGDATCQ